MSIREFVRHVARRDWDAVAALCADSFIEFDHRAFASLGTTRGTDAWVRNFRELVELAPDTAYRVHHFHPEARGYYSHGGWFGTREGGPYELVVNAVLELDNRGRIVRADMYDNGGVEAALARLAELAEGETRDSPTRIAKPKAASLWPDRFRLAFNTRDWGALHTLFAPEATYEDRQRLSLVSGGLDMLLSSVRARAEAGFLVERVELLGAAGRRVAIQRMLWAGGGDAARVEVEFIVLQEVDDAGRLRASITFDPGAARAAQREAWARWAAIDPEMQEPLAVISGLTDRFNDGDRAGIRALCADDLFGEDHRLTGIGRIDGVDAYMESLVAVWELAADQRLELGWYWPAYTISSVPPRASRSCAHRRPGFPLRHSFPLRQGFGGRVGGRVPIRCGSRPTRKCDFSSGSMRSGVPDGSTTSAPWWPTSSASRTGRRRRWSWGASRSGYARSTSSGTRRARAPERSPSQPPEIGSRSTAAGGARRPARGASRSRTTG